MLPSKVSREDEGLRPSGLMLALTPPILNSSVTPASPKTVVMDGAWAVTSHDQGFPVCLNVPTGYPGS